MYCVFIFYSAYVLYVQNMYNGGVVYFVVELRGAPGDSGHLHGLITWTSD